MKATTFLVAATLLGIGLLAMPLDTLAPAGTAAAQTCTQELREGVDAYVECETSRCHWDPKRPLVVMCYD